MAVVFVKHMMPVGKDPCAVFHIPTCGAPVVMVHISNPSTQESEEGSSL